MRIEKVVWPLAEVEPYRCVGSEQARGWYQDLEQVWTARGRQKYFASEWFEQANRRWEKMLTRIGLEQDVFWTQAQDVAHRAVWSTLQSRRGGRWQCKAVCRVNRVAAWVGGRQAALGENSSGHCQ